MRIQPLSSFTDTLAASKFPALKLYWHQDDLTSGSLTWIDRILGVVITSSLPMYKDSTGVYTGATATLTISTLPIAGQNCCLVNVFKCATASATGGGAVQLGTVTANNGPGISTNGGFSQVSDGTIATATFAATPTGIGKNACRSVALRDAGANAICVLAHDDGATTTIANDTTAVVGGIGTITEIASLPLTSAISGGSFNAATDDGRRGKIIALFNFSAELTLNELQLACSEMARTGELYAGWINRT